MAKRITWDNVIEVLLERVPELQDVYQGLVDAYGVPPLQYWLIGDVERFAYKLCRAASDPAAPDVSAQDALRRLMAALEEMATSDEQNLRDLMGAGFVEIMNPNDPCFNHLVSLMGPATRKSVVDWFGPIEQWTDGIDEQAVDQ